MDSLFQIHFSLLDFFMIVLVFMVLQIITWGLCDFVGVFLCDKEMKHYAMYCSLLLPKLVASPVHF